MNTIRVVQLRKMPIFKMLALEEHLLEQPCENFLLINYGTPDAIVLGKSNDRQSLIEKTTDVPLIRRFSGGGTVYVDHSTLFITWILSKELTQAKCVDTLFDWTVNTLQKAHPNLNIKRVETDYVIGDKKVGGTAQYVKKDRILHHTSFLFDYSKEKLQSLKHPLKAPNYRNGRTHENFLTTLKAHFSTMEDFINPYAETLQKDFHVETTSLLEILIHLQKPKQTVILES